MEIEHVIHEERKLSFFERYLTVCVIICIGFGVLLGKLFSGFAVALDGFSIGQLKGPALENGN